MEYIKAKDCGKLDNMLDRFHRALLMPIIERLEKRLKELEATNER